MNTKSKKISWYSVSMMSAYVFFSVCNFTYAQTTSLSGLTCSMSPKTFKDLVMNMFIGCIVNPLIPVLIGIAVLFFIWGAFKFTIAEGDEKKKSKDYMVWGIVGLFIMVSLWGIVNILEYTFKLDTSTTVTPRSFNLQNLVK